VYLFDRWRGEFLERPRRADGSGTKITKLTKITNNLWFFFVIFVALVIFVPQPSVRFSRVA